MPFDNAKLAGSVRALFLLAVFSLSACGDRDDNGARDPSSDNAGDHPAVGAGTDRQTAYRIRRNVEAGLNADDGWAAEVNQVATVAADRPFRLRFEVESSDETSGARQHRLDVRRNGGVWAPLPAENFPQPEKVHDFELDSVASGTVDKLWQFLQGDATAMRWQADEGDGHLAVETAEQAMLALARHRIPWRIQELALELRFNAEQQARAGLVFDFQERENHARVEVVWPDTVRVVRVESGISSIVAEHRAVIDAERWIELKTIVEGRKLKVEFDDEALVFSETLAAAIPSPMLGLYVPVRSAADFRSISIEGEPNTPRTSIVAADAFDNEAPTQDLLPVSERPFSGGAGVSFAEQTAPWVAGGGHGEWEFPIVIRRFSDRAALNETGDRFEYRLVQVGSDALPAEITAQVILEVPEDHLGGTFVETPMRLGPWQAENGDLYFPMEPAETWNALMTVKSSDGGQSWREIDGENRPETDDLEGFGSVLVDDRIHMLHQTSNDVWYHAFNTSDHPEAPDAWAIRDERVASPPEPPTQVADIAVRSDGSMVAVYGGPDKIRLRIRSTGGEWGEERVVDADTPEGLSGPTVVRGQDDVIHMAYVGNDGSAWYRRVLPDGQLTERVRFTSTLGTESVDVGSILPLLYLPGSDSVSLIYRTREGLLHDRRVDGDGQWTDPLVVSERSVAQNPVDSDQTGADAIVHGDAVHVLLIEESTGRLFHSSRSHGAWSEANLLIDDEKVQWVRGYVVEKSNGEQAYGYVYDAGSDGGSGMNRYGQIPLQAR